MLPPSFGQIFVKSVKGSIYFLSLLLFLASCGYILWLVKKFVTRHRSNDEDSRNAEGFAMNPPIRANGHAHHPDTTRNDAPAPAIV